MGAFPGHATFAPGDDDLAWREAVVEHPVLGPWGDPFHPADDLSVGQVDDPDVEAVG